MTKFLLTDWEINGYDDSDFMCSYFDEEQNLIGYHCYGSTRFPSASVIGINPDGSTSVEVFHEILWMPTPTIVEKARAVLEDNILHVLTANDKRKVDEPGVNEMHEGLDVILTADVKNQVRASDPCQKCNASGKWTNPKNPNDKRDCFACKGTGQHKGDKLKTDSGKQVWDVIPSGTAGKVIGWTSFGRFYANGYNHPDRTNTTVQVKGTDKKVFRSALKNLSLACGYQSPTDLRKQAKDMSFAYNFSAGYPKHAWDTRNFAAEIAGKKPEPASIAIIYGC
jgi:hypothetical protein